ncbi:MAG: 50S ribosomal protein L11 methyltransferase [Gammaproteobacteria bacterium]|nr:50S ribosomal protein L11 methyltransferase [Gammaproteobacteria bacterium]
MNWLQVHIDVDADAAAELAEGLEAAGAVAVSLDAADDTPRFDDRGEGGAELWPSTRVSGLFAPEVDVRAVAAAAWTGIGRHPPVPLRVETVADADWEAHCRQQFAPRRYGERLVVRPSWSEPLDADTAQIVLDPGMAFGTGAHATTALCLTWLTELPLAGRRVVDYGCGSGILAIAAARLGAAEVWAVDVDPGALSVARDNARANGVQARVRIGPVDILDGICADIVVANILLDPLRALAVVLAGLLRDGGRLGLSGILAQQVQDCAAAYADAFDLAPARIDDGWALLCGMRRERRPC